MGKVQKLEGELAEKTEGLLGHLKKEKEDEL